MNIPQLILSIVDVAAAIFLIAVVLLQSGKSAGLSGAIAGVADTFMAKNRAKTWGRQAGQADQMGGHRLCGNYLCHVPALRSTKPPSRSGGRFCIFRCRMRQNYGTIAADAAPVGGGTRSIPTGGPECGRKGTMI